MEKHTYWLYRKSVEEDGHDNSVLLCRLEGTEDDARDLLQALTKMSTDEFVVFQLDKEVDYA